MLPIIYKIIFFCLISFPFLFAVCFINEEINSSRCQDHHIRNEIRRRKTQEIEWDIVKSFRLNNGNVYLTALDFMMESSEAGIDYVRQVTKKYGVWYNYYDDHGNRHGKTT